MKWQRMKVIKTSSHFSSLHRRYFFKQSMDVVDDMRVCVLYKIVAYVQDHIKLDRLYDAWLKCRLVCRLTVLS